MRSRLPGNITLDPSFTRIRRPRFRPFVASSGGALTITLLDSVKADSGALTIVSNDVFPTSGSLILIFIANADRKVIASITSEFDSEPTWTDPGLSAVLNAGRDPSIDFWWGNFTSGSGTITVTHNAGTPDSRQLNVYEVTGGHNTTTPIINGVSETNSVAIETTASLTVTAPTAGNLSVGAICNMHTVTASANVITPGTNFTELKEDFTTVTNEGCWLQVQYDDTTLGTEVDWSTLKRFKAYLAFEIQAA